MNTLDDLDRQLLDDLNELPGWEALTSAPAPVVSPEILARATSAVLEAIAADASRTMAADLIRTGSRPVAPARRRRTRWAMGAIAGVAAAMLVIAVPTISTPGNPPASVASASQFLTQLAATATAAPGIDHKYWKVTFTSINPLNPAAGSSQETTTTIWYGRDGGQWLQTAGDTVVRANDATAQFALPYDAALTWTEVTQLSSDPAALEAHLRSLVGPNGSVVDAAANLLASAPLNAGQRAALFTILSHQPGVTIREDVTDTAGRTGSALDFPVGPTQTMSLLLAADGTLLQQTDVASADSDTVIDSPGVAGSSPSPVARQVTEKGDVVSRQTYLQVGGTDTAPGK